MRDLEAVERFRLCYDHYCNARGELNMIGAILDSGVIPAVRNEEGRRRHKLRVKRLASAASALLRVGKQVAITFEFYGIDSRNLHKVLRELREGSPAYLTDELEDDLSVLATKICTAKQAASAGAQPAASQKKIDRAKALAMEDKGLLYNIAELARRVHCHRTTLAGSKAFMVWVKDQRRAFPPPKKARAGKAFQENRFVSKGTTKKGQRPPENPE